MKKITNFFKPLNKRPLTTDADEPRSSGKRLRNNENIGRSFYRAIESEFRKEYYEKLSEFVRRERLARTVYPPESLVFSWTQMCEIHDVKVIILGQDPYHGPKQANGLAFSVQKGVQIPPSLVNIYKELADDIRGFETPNHGDLTGWAKQGVLLLNASLTVAANNANSHAGKGWEQLTDAVIRWIDANLEHCVFLLWGLNAQKKRNLIKNNHLCLATVHPSPLSAHKGFLGCKHFSRANEYLEKNGKKPIEWNLL